MDSNDMKVSMNKTKIRICRESCKEIWNTGRWPCVACGMGVAET